ncbi:MAG: pantoate--beta-alanine ligase [Bacteroides sp. SM23_62]|nr:MAG: pantoate--beta-alanine ligase [Bacteroides sp. SM23_62]
MLVPVKTIQEARKQLKSLWQEEGSLGFVPTMGALHEGHLSLIRRSVNDNRFTVVSIFVNPTQFNEKHDFDHYPRNLETDLEIMSSYPIDLVFAPEAPEIYPEPDTRRFDFGGLDKTMEGLHRPGHFNGVAQVVSRLLDIVRPDRVYFGEKDFQQLAIVRAMVRQLEIPVEIIGCPIIREADGLAMSSRNKLLTPEQRTVATGISKALLRARDLAGTLPVDKLQEMIIDQLSEYPILKVEYFQIVDRESLQPVREWSDEGAKIGCIAVQIGKVRLIDNINISS